MDAWINQKADENPKRVKIDDVEIVLSSRFLNMGLTGASWSLASFVFKLSICYVINDDGRYFMEPDGSRLCAS